MDLIRFRRGSAERHRPIAKLETPHLYAQPTMQPTIDLTCTYFEGLTQPSETCKLLNVRDSYRLAGFG